MKPLALAICLLIGSGGFHAATAQANVQSCAPSKDQAIDDVQIRLDAIVKNLHDWQTANRNHADFDRTEYLIERIGLAQELIERAVNLTYISDLAEMQRVRSIVTYSNGVIGGLKGRLQQMNSFLNGWLQRISHPYVIAEGREARSAIDSVLALIANCQPFERRR